MVLVHARALSPHPSARVPDQHTRVCAHAIHKTNQSMSMYMVQFDVCTGKEAREYL